MIIKVLGSAAGGAFPQWNCNGAQSRAVRNGDPGFRPRTQASVAVSGDGRRWVLLNCSPDIRQQILATPELHPRADDGPRNSPIRAVVLTGAEIDHIAGLLSLRERQPYTIYATTRVLETLAANSIFDALDKRIVPRAALSLDTPIGLSEAGVDLGLIVEAFAVPGKIALYLERGTAGDGYGTDIGDTIGLKVTEAATGRYFFYIPGCAAIDRGLRQRLATAPLVFFDGTLYTDDELIVQGLSDKTGRRMGHVPVSGENGSLAAFATLNVHRRIYIHINNSNPILDEHSSQRATVAQAGWEVAHDGLDVHTGNRVTR
ncbi:MAG: pyrroloquinoline quinone biosynthesis protein PqqB [Hyphomicrobiaceae bacterium]